VEKLGVTKGNTVELNKVLLIADGGKVTVGAPTIDGAKVIATSQGDSKSKKVIVFKYKSKVRYRKKTGHRQTLTKLTIDNIIGTEGQPGEAKSEVKRVRRRKKEVTESGA
jgi:large subunit ribosomal protein L21